MEKDSEYRKLIHTGRWLQLRKQALTAHPLCQRCLKNGNITPATEVHHIQPVEEALSSFDQRQRMFDPSNLLPLCHDCHVQAHIELGRSGKAATQQRTKKKLEEIKKKYL